MKKAIVLGILLLIGLGAGPGRSNEPAGLSAEDYIIGPRDILEIAVWGEDNLHLLCEVSAYGTINYFFLGDVKVAGLTLKQAREKITALLANGYINNPVVILRINNFKSKEVQITGAVDRPGTYVLETNDTTLLKLISMAGGTTYNRGNFALIYRGGAERLKEEKAKQHDSSPEMAAPEHGNTADKAEPITVPPNSLKGQENIQVDLRLLLDQGKPENDVKVMPGDFVLIQSKLIENLRLNYVFVDGAVRSPRQVDYIEGMTALQAITQAGGFSDLASPNRTYVTRLGPDGKIFRFRIKLKDVQRGKRPDEPLKPGDRILVQESWF
ncbi:MAG TPA: polysaccharide biosynthesis/export family protein [bacterium]|nr:polysaccharide biosynthesis/export family protein [bacterium]